MKNRVEHEIYESEDQSRYYGRQVMFRNIFSVRQVADKRLVHIVWNHSLSSQTYGKHMIIEIIAGDGKLTLSL